LLDFARSYHVASILGLLNGTGLEMYDGVDKLTLILSDKPIEGRFFLSGHIQGLSPFVYDDMLILIGPFLPKNLRGVLHIL
jgi:hypothetical protein